jgi:hypothetical protein
VGRNLGTRKKTETEKNRREKSSKFAKIKSSRSTSLTFLGTTLTKSYIVIFTQKRFPQSHEPEFECWKPI